MSDGDDWRTTIDLADAEHRSRLVGSLRGRRLVGEARAKVGDRVVVTHEGPRLFFYTDTEESARAVQELAGSLLSEHDLHGTITLSRWHPIEERWEDGDAPLPESAEDEAAELARREEADRARSRQQGFPEWDVRMTLPSREQAVAFAIRLEDEGHTVVRRAEVMIAGAETESDARALAERLEAEAPAGTIVEVEVNRAEAWDEAHPFAFLGGLAN